jgi:hypothetical protein
MGWDRPFDQPVPLPSGPPARTLRDAANYIKKLSKLDHDTPEWRLAVQMLLMPPKIADQCYSLKREFFEPSNVTSSRVSINRGRTILDCQG